MATPAGPPPLPWSDHDLAARHLLLLPVGIEADEVEALAVSRFAAAEWEASGEVVRTSVWGRPVRGPAPVRALRLSRHSRLVGPHALAAGDTARLGAPASMVAAFVVETPRERGDRPYPGGGDRDGINRAFPDGLPVRDEERVVRWLVAAARRVGGAVRIGGGGPVLVPDVQGAIDLTVFSDVWLEPQAALDVMRRVTPRATLAMDPVPWEGPPPGIGERNAPGTTGLPDAARRSLHAEADAFDVAALSAPDELGGYGVQTDLGLDGLLALEVAGEDVLPLVVRGLPWTLEGAVVYRVRWEPPEFEDLELERPSHAHRVARRRVQSLVGALARELHRAVGGEVADSDEFLVDPRDL